MIAQLRIISNPHLESADARQLAEELMEQRERLYGFAITEAKLDEGAFTELKDFLAKKSRSITVK